MSKRNILFVVGLLLVGGLLFWMIASALDASVYMVGVDEVLAQEEHYANKDFKVVGYVVPKSIRVTSDGRVRFGLTKGGAVLEVDYGGQRPDTFADCAEVIVGGRLLPGQRFAAETLLAKCPSKYDTLPADCDQAPPGREER